MVAVLSAISVVPISRTPSSKMKFNELQSANRTYVLRYHLICMTEIPRYLFYLRQSHATRFSGISQEKLGKSLLHPQAPSVSYTYASRKNKRSIKIKKICYILCSLFVFCFTTRPINLNANITQNAVYEVTRGNFLQSETVKPTL